jgi:hypothetical protein
MLAVAAADMEQVEKAGCSGRCRNLIISNPFWLTDLDTGRSCGSPDFEVTCLDNIPVIPSAVGFKYGFQIMGFSYEEKSMHVVDLRKLRLLNASSSCNEPIWNTSEKLWGRPFLIDPGNLNLIIYNCTTNASTAAARRDGGLVETTMRCRNESQLFVRVEGSYGQTRAIEGCDAVVLPVLGGANGEANAIDYERLIAGGFLLTWENPSPPLARKFTLFKSSFNQVSLSR